MTARACACIAALIGLGCTRADTRLVDVSELCSTGARLVKASPQGIRVDAGGMRAVVAGDKSRVVELRFTYQGPSTETVPLANGELRRQIGLKLRAADTCNVVYVMWHAEPTAEVAVSVKHNPGATTHAACGDRGYQNLHAEKRIPVPAFAAGELHRLRAELKDDTLRVLADGAPVWTGRLPADAFEFDGPSGIRTDNGIFDFELRVADPRRADARCP